MFTVKKIIAWILIIVMIISSNAFTIYAEKSNIDTLIENEAQKNSIEDFNQIDSSDTEKEDVSTESEGISTEEEEDGTDKVESSIEGEKDGSEKEDGITENEESDTKKERDKIDDNDVNSLTDLVNENLDGNDIVSTDSNINDLFDEDNYVRTDLKNSGELLFGAAGDITYTIKYHKNTGDEWEIYDWDRNHLTFEELCPDGTTIASASATSFNTPIKLAGTLYDNEGYAYRWVVREEINREEFTAEKAFLGWSTSPTGEVEYTYNKGFHITQISDSSKFDTITHELHLYAKWSDREDAHCITYWWCDDTDYDVNFASKSCIKIYDKAPGGRAYYSDILNANKMIDPFIPWRGNIPAPWENYGDNVMLVCGAYRFNVGEEYNPHARPNVNQFNPRLIDNWCYNNWWNRADSEKTSFQIGLCYKNIDYISIEKSPVKTRYTPGSQFAPNNGDLTGLTLHYNFDNYDTPDEVVFSGATVDDTNYTFDPARNSTLPTEPQTLNVKVFHKGNEVRDRLPIFIGNDMIKLRIVPADKGTFGAGYNNEISFTNIADFNTYKANVNITTNDGYEYINVWENGIDITNYTWNGKDNVTLTATLSTLLRFVIKDEDSAKGHFITGVKTKFNRNEKNDFLSAPFIELTNGYHFDGWVKNGTSNPVAPESITYDNSYDIDNPVTYTARISQIFTYRITFSKGDYDTNRYKFLDPWPNDIIITTSSTVFSTPIVMPSMRLVWKDDDGDYSWKYNVTSWHYWDARGYNRNVAPGQALINDVRIFRDTRVLEITIGNHNNVREPIFKVYKHQMVGDSGTDVAHEFYRYNDGVIDQFNNYVVIADDKYKDFYRGYHFFNVDDPFDHYDWDKSGNPTLITIDELKTIFLNWVNSNTDPHSTNYGAIYHGSDVSLITQINKTTYDEGEKFDPTGLVLTHKYMSGATSEVYPYDGNENAFIFEPGLDTLLTPDIKKIKITHGWNAVFPHVAELNITVIASDSKPAPNPSPPSSGSRNISSGGSRGSGGSGSVLTEFKTLVLSSVKSIKGVLNADTGVWNYDVVHDKWKFAAVNQAGQYINATDGFYIIVKNQSVVVNNISITVPVNYTYYFDDVGYMFEGFIKTIDNKTYFFENVKNKDNGVMVVGWKQIQGKWYYFDEDGAMFINSITPDGYIIGADGTWRQ